MSARHRLNDERQPDTHQASPLTANLGWSPAALQAVGTLSAKRRLRQLSDRQRRFQKATNHRISKRLVAKAKRTKRAIAIEELTGIRQRTRARRPEQRARHSNWAFAQLRKFISSKAQRAGVPVVTVEPA